MKNTVIFIMIISFVLAPNIAFAKDWVIGNSDAKATTTVSGSSGSSINSSSTAQMFKKTKEMVTVLVVAQITMEIFLITSVPAHIVILQAKKM